MEVPEVNKLEDLHPGEVLIEEFLEPLDFIAQHPSLRGYLMHAVYPFVEDLVVSGFVDRIIYCSDQMNWPGAIEAVINAINKAPFLTGQKKKAILHALWC